VGWEWERVLCVEPLIQLQPLHPPIVVKHTKGVLGGSSRRVILVVAVHIGGAKADFGLGGCRIDAGLGCRSCELGEIEGCDLPKGGG
jgi:hypothetical protein